MGLHSDLTPTILSIAEATHYLVGTTDDNDNFIALPQLNDVVVCDSLSSAKQVLKDHHFHKAKLTLQTAYDEMCGLPATKPITELVVF
jgi:hypothetical protein